MGWYNIQGFEEMWFSSQAKAEEFAELNNAQYCIASSESEQSGRDSHRQRERTERLR